MVVNLIMRPCRLRSFANQTGPRRSETSGRADLSGTGHKASAHAEMSTSSARLSMHELEYSLTLSRHRSDRRGAFSHRSGGLSKTQFEEV